MTHYYYYTLERDFNFYLKLFYIFVGLNSLKKKEIDSFFKKRLFISLTWYWILKNTVSYFHLYFKHIQNLKIKIEGDCVLLLIFILFYMNYVIVIPWN